jgi:hypothetical protein
MIDLRLLTTDPSCKITKRDWRRTIALPIPWLTRSPGLLSRRALTGISRPQASALGPALCSRKAGTLASKLDVKYAGSVPRRFALIFKGKFPSYRTIMNADYALGRPNAYKTCRCIAMKLRVSRSARATDRRVGAPSVRNLIERFFNKNQAVPSCRDRVWQAPRAACPDWERRERWRRTCQQRKSGRHHRIGQGDARRHAQPAANADRHA